MSTPTGRPEARDEKAAEANPEAELRDERSVALAALPARVLDTRAPRELVSAGVSAAPREVDRRDIDSIDSIPSLSASWSRSPRATMHMPLSSSSPGRADTDGGRSAARYDSARLDAPPPPPLGLRSLHEGRVEGGVGDGVWLCGGEGVAPGSRQRLGVRLCWRRGRGLDADAAVGGEKSEGEGAKVEGGKGEEDE